jgi:hypothetical protein
VWRLLVHIGRMGKDTLVVAVLRASSGNERTVASVGLGESNATVRMLDYVQRAAMVVRPNDVVRVDAPFAIEAVGRGQQRTDRTVNMR